MEKRPIEQNIFKHIIELQNEIEPFGSYSVEPNVREGEILVSTLNSKGHFTPVFIELIIKYCHRNKFRFGFFENRLYIEVYTK